MSDRKSYRTLEEWFALIQECRKSGMTDAQWCLANGISRHTLNKAITRLRKRSYEIPSKQPHDIYDLTSPSQDVVKLDIVPDVRPSEDLIPKTVQHIDNSHMIEITFGDTHIANVKQNFTWQNHLTAHNFHCHNPGDFQCSSNQ